MICCILNQFHIKSISARLQYLRVHLGERLTLSIERKRESQMSLLQLGQVTQGLKLTPGKHQMQADFVFGDVLEGKYTKIVIS